MDTEQTTGLLPIVIEGHTFSPNAEGLWSLNEIHKTLALDPAKIASKWNNADRAALHQRRNFVIAHGGPDRGTMATEAGTIAYAMWVSPDFYLMVIHAFVAMRNDAITSARMASLALIAADKQLADNLPKADALDHRAKRFGISWFEACRAVGIQRPRLAKAYLLSIGKFTMSKGIETVESPRPIALGFSRGFFRRDESAFGGHDGWKVTDKGLVWLKGLAQEINEAIRQREMRKAKATRERNKGKRQAAKSIQVH